ncbi:GNAT family N-acetyltransferase [Streptacidiphilus anmyonensis]|uniref:GNAT family N-acetyltransferase n=1 Tax=Streptacidiphilus anmyonensis TaxID=405782 RepID=UPI0005AA5DEA|nr:GNAT family N-acetyltransferase [Streptacidiphilus anmyonensis]
MTTTLRPTGPERIDELGSRERSFTVCVNGRAVGGIQLQASQEGSGRISGLSIADRDRGRGRGTTAVLAAEEVLRSWGCTRAESTVEDGPEVERVLRWTRSLGYALNGRNMVKDLPSTPPELPAGLTARPLTAGEFEAWQEAHRESYAATLVRHTGRTPEQAAAKAAADHAWLFPQGLDSPGVSIHHLLAGGESVGTIWVSTATPTREAHPAWVFNVKVGEAFRGRGYGRALMLLAERVTLAAGVGELALNVHAGNVPAERLYDSLGYRPFRWAVAKTL